MLAMKPECETCQKALLLNDPLVYICSYECTFCEDCVKQKHLFICPNCGGDLQLRPKRT